MRWGPWGSCSANPGLRSPEGSRGERPVLSSKGSYWESKDHHGWRSFGAQKIDGGAGRRSVGSAGSPGLSLRGDIDSLTDR